MALVALAVSVTALLVGVGGLWLTWGQFRHEASRRHVERTPNFTFRWDSASRLALMLQGPEPLANVSVRVPTSGTAVVVDSMPWPVGTERKLPELPSGSGGLRIVVDARSADGHDWQVPISAGDPPGGARTTIKPWIEPWWASGEGCLELYLRDGPANGYDEASIRLRGAKFVMASDDALRCDLGHTWPRGYVWKLPRIEPMGERFDVIARVRVGESRWTSTLTVPSKSSTESVAPNPRTE